ncbi:nucleoside transporter [Nitzschia inconspicua]|uniref:Nucleoside transporter n=1 Tax=Nitzschia inconspicua TaxID=303405 RepID=A0A9K3PQL3_9STRA|nr:nucleoside transporter [Nitzschia inconspicua]
MSPPSPHFAKLKQQRRINFLPLAATNVVSEGFIEIVFFLLGVGILLPWNAYISAKQYFVSRICEEDPQLAQRIEMWFSILYNGACVLSLAVVIFVQYVTDDNNRNKNSVCVNNMRSRSLFRTTSNLSIPMMCSKTLRVDATRASGSDTYTWYMVMIPLGVYLAVFAMTTIFVFTSSIHPQLFLMLTLLGLFICGVCTAVASSGIVGTAGLFDANVGVNPYFNGQAAGGLLVACANFLTSVLDGETKYLEQYCKQQQPSIQEGTIATTEETGMCLPYSEVSWATAGYFGMSCVILAACMVGYSYVDEYKHLVRKNSLFGDPYDNLTGNIACDCDADVDDNVDDNDDDDDDSNEGEKIQYLSIENVPQDETGSNRHESTLSKWRRKALVSFASYEISSIPSPHENSELTPLRRESDISSGDGSSENTQSVTFTVWTAVRGSAVSLFFTYFCTLAIFPVWTSNLVSMLQCQSSSRIRNDLFTPISFVIFNGGDLIGRSLSSGVKYEKVENLSSKLVWASIFRMAFFVLFLFCDSGNNRYSTWVVPSDTFSWSIQFLFAVSNGFMTNICFCYAPSLVGNRTHPQQVASAILNFSLSFGLLMGSFVSGLYFQLANAS